MICLIRLIFSRNKQRNVALSRRDLLKKPTVNFGSVWRSVGTSCYELNSLRATAPVRCPFQNPFQGGRGSQDATLHSWKREPRPPVHRDDQLRCPLYPQKRTSAHAIRMSASGQKQ